MNWKVIIERGFWTFVETFLGVLLGAAFLDVSVHSLEVAAMAGLASLLSFIKTIGMYRLQQLPDMGYPPTP
jgi:hypothetical protein